MRLNLQTSTNFSAFSLEAPVHGTAILTTAGYKSFEFEIASSAWNPLDCTMSKFEMFSVPHFRKKGFLLRPVVQWSWWSLHSLLSKGEGRLGEHSSSILVRPLRHPGDLACSSPRRICRHWKDPQTYRNGHPCEEQRWFKRYQRAHLLFFANDWLWQSSGYVCRRARYRESEECLWRNRWKVEQPQV